jgi:hypothetical protein
MPAHSLKRLTAHHAIAREKKGGHGTPQQHTGKKDVCATAYCPFALHIHGLVHEARD